ncbi:hypothetical protein [Maribacter sp. R77961]|uniref:hypothetical protein n=1 Tax=Maribacter sp. R77961 TaxID=3093871 RepID=UPI0037CB5A92
MKKQFLTICLACLVFTAVNAQVSQSTGDLRSQATTCGDLDALFTQSGNSLHNLIYADINASSTATTGSAQTIKGSPFLADNFQESKIYVNDQLLGSFYSRFNAYSQEIEIKKTNLEEEQHKALIKDENIRIVFDDKVLQYASFVDEDGKVTQDYLISMLSGSNYNLYQRYSVKYVEGKEAENSMVNAIPARFTNKTQYYLKDLNANLVSYIPTKKSKLLDLFSSDKKMQVAALIKKKGLNLKKESSLVQILTFANTLNTVDLASQGK